MPAPTTTTISQLFPGSGPGEAVIRVWGYNLTTSTLSRYDGGNASRILNVSTIEVDPIGEIRMAFAIPYGSTPVGALAFTLEESGTTSNALPYTIE